MGVRSEGNTALETAVFYDLDDRRAEGIGEEVAGWRAEARALGLRESEVLLMETVFTEADDTHRSRPPTRRQ